MRQLCLQVGAVLGSEPEFSEEVHDFIGTSKYRVAALEGGLSKERLEHCGARMPPSFPLAVGHSDLVQVCEERIHPVEVGAAGV